MHFAQTNTNEIKASAPTRVLSSNAHRFHRAVACITVATMHVTNAIWWRHAYVFSICAFFQSLWITLQLRHQWSVHWYGIFLWLYLALIYWAWHNYTLMILRGDHHRHGHGVPRRSSTNNAMQSNMELAPAPHNERDSWDASPQYGDEEDQDEEERDFSAGNIYRNDSSEQHYTADELQANAPYHQRCTREADESRLSYRLRRALTMQQWVRLATLAAGVVMTVMLVVKLEDSDSFGWWVWWLVASIMLGVVMVMSVVGAFWVPVRAWYIHAYISGQRAAVLHDVAPTKSSASASGYVDKFLGNNVQGLSYN